MQIYLVQHGEAKSESEDPHRPLTKMGRDDVESVVRHLARSRTAVQSILHSGRLRAKQTAELFAQHLAPPQGIAEKTGLGPKDDPAEARQLAEQAGEPMMIVGHLPHLSRLASSLILDNPEKELIAFRMGGVVCLGKRNGAWLVNWILSPELAIGS